MSTLTSLLTVIEAKLNNSTRPEFELFQLIETASETEKTDIIIAMIGKLIEQNKRLAMNMQKR